MEVEQKLLYILYIHNLTVVWVGHFCKATSRWHIPHHSASFQLFYLSRQWLSRSRVGDLTCQIMNELVYRHPRTLLFPFSSSFSADVLFIFAA